MGTTYAVALDVDQKPSLGGLCARQAGSKEHCRSYIGHYPGANQQVFPNASHRIELESSETFRSSTGGTEAGGIYKVTDR